MTIIDDFEQAPGQATPEDVLHEQLMDPGVPKTEREHYAAREITRLEEACEEIAGECGKWLAEYHRLRKAIEDAPHGPGCAAYVPLANGFEDSGYEVMHSRCNCWKREALKR